MFAVLSSQSPIVQHPAGILAVLLTVLAVIFWLAGHPVFGRLFKVIPALVFCYFVPAALATGGLIPVESELYSFVKTFVLPASLVLLILALDLRGIVKLGPKAMVMLLAGTFGVVIGGPIALLITRSMLPPDTWQGMSTLAGSWIGGGANMLALKEASGASEEMYGAMVVVDAAVGGVWMGILLYMSGRQKSIDRWTGADAQAIRDLERRMEDFQQRSSRVASVSDFMQILAIAFLGGWLSYKTGEVLGEFLVQSETLSFITVFVPKSAWKYVIVTTLGVALSLTPARRLEGAGASKMGTVMIYLLVTCIGAGADFTQIWNNPGFLVMGAIWMLIHVVVLLGVGWLIRAPIFFIAVGSQANIGGAATAPVVASAFHPSLAPVGALLAVAGYVLGTYCGLLCMYLLKIVAGV